MIRAALEGFLLGAALGVAGVVLLLAHLGVLRW